jgi:hypothetical protein
MNIKLGVSATLSSLVLFAIMVTVPAKASIISFSSTINGAQANAGTGTGSIATGSASMLFDDVTNELSWSIDWVDLSGPATSAHFHGPALPNTYAGAVVFF